MKLLTLNMCKGLCLSALIAFIKEERFDLIQLQEVAGGEMAEGHIDCFEQLKKETGLSGVLSKNWHYKEDPASYVGNATLFLPSWKVKEQTIVALAPFEEIDPHNKPPFEAMPKSALLLQLEGDGKSLWWANTHQAWSPTPKDTPHKIDQARTLASAIEALNAPFVLTGDFNVTAETEVIKIFDKLGRNLSKENKVTNTLDPRLHRAQHLFPPGLAVDFIFIHPKVACSDFKVLSDISLSDHFGLTLTL